MKHSRYSTLLRWLLVLVALGGLLYWAAETSDRFRIGLHLSGIARAPFTFDADTRVITSMQPEAKQAGLGKGSTLDSLNGAAYTGLAQWAAVLNPADPGDRILAGFQRPDGSHAQAAITLAAAQPHAGLRVGLSQTWQNFFLFNFIPLVCMLVGYWVVFVKPNDPNAWLLLILLLYPQTLFTGKIGGFSTGSVLILRDLYFQFVQPLGAPALLLFALYFPERSRIDSKLPWLKWIVLGSFIVCSLIGFRQLYGQYFLAGNAQSLLRVFAWADHVANATALLCIALYLLLLYRKSQTASTADSRRRLRVLLAGTGTGLVALELAFVLLPALGYSAVAHGHLWMVYLGVMLFLLAPLTLAYVVLVQRAMDVSILLRQGTKYALARATVLFMQAALVVIVAYHSLLPLLTEQQVSRGQLLELLLFLILIAMLRIVFGKRLSAWLDKKFFREAYNSERVLSELSVEVRRYTESGPLLQTVSRCVAETLHVSHIAMLLRDGSAFTLAQTVGMPALALGNGFALPVTSSTIRRLNNSSAPAELYREAPEAWYMLAGAAERRTLDELGAELLLALPGRDRLMGVMALGPKQSQAAYSPSDLSLLQMLAAQTGMALEVSELAHSLAAEAAQRERANREMEIAREVQERLFPQAMPVLAAGSIAGFCRPALGVGGDYYDVFPLEDGRLGIAIGDVSGKGISARC